MMSKKNQQLGENYWDVKASQRWEDRCVERIKWRALQNRRVVVEEKLGWDSGRKSKDKQFDAEADELGGYQWWRFGEW